MDIKSRVIGLINIKASEIKANKKNYRRHPKGQIAILRKMIEKIGYIAPILVVKENDEYIIVDGHLRTGIAEDSEIPAVLLDLNPQEVEEALATLDPIAQMAKVDRDILEGIIKEVSLPSDLLEEMSKKGWIGKSLENFGFQITPEQAEEFKHIEGFALPVDKDEQAMTPPEAKNEVGGDAPPVVVNDKGLKEKEELAAMGGSLESVEIVNDPDQIFVMTANAVFKSNLPFDIPALKTDRLFSLPTGIIKTFSGADTRWAEEDTPDTWWVYVYKSAGVDAVPKDRSMVCFYTDDSAFEQVWNDPVKYTRRMLDKGFRVSMCPNYSLWDNMPEASWVWNTYRSRWLARFFQEAGIYIIPDIVFPGGEGDKWERVLEYLFAGIPRNAPVVSCQFQTVHGSEESARRGLDYAVRLLNPRKIIIYGTPAFIRENLGSLEWFDERAITVASWSRERIKHRYADTSRESLNSIGDYDSYVPGTV